MRLIDADALVWKIMVLCRSYQKTHLVHAEMLETFTNSVLAYIDHAEEHKTEVKVIQYDSNLPTEPCKSAEQNVADVPSGDEYVPNKACFDCMERGTGFCKGTIQEQSWCPIVAKANTEPSGDLISRADAIDCCECHGSQECKDRIKALPSADRPKGEWIRVTNGRGGHECSNCHAYAPSYMSGDEYLSDFCPNCGADMRPEK